MMNRDSNAYTFGFAAAMVVVVASVLAFTASSLKDLQQENVRKEKCKTYSQRLALKPIAMGLKSYSMIILFPNLPCENDGTVDQAVDPFSGIKLALELKKEPKRAAFPTLFGKRKGSVILYYSSARFWAMGCHLGVYRFGIRSEYDQRSCV